MTKKSLSIIKIVLSSIGLLGSIALIIISSILSSKRFENISYSYDLDIVKLTSEQPSISSGIVYHNVVVDGSVRNLTEKDYKSVIVVVYFNGVNKSTSIEADYKCKFIVENFNSGSVVDISKKELKVGDKNGFMPTEIKKVEIILDGATEITAYQVREDTNLVVLFGLGFGGFVLSALLLSMVVVKLKKEKTE